MTQLLNIIHKYRFYDSAINIQTRMIYYIINPNVLLLSNRMEDTRNVKTFRPRSKTATNHRAGLRH